MINVICDMCKKPIPEAVKDKNYVTFMDKSLCVSCMREFQDEVREIMEEEGGAEPNNLKYKNYDFYTYREVMQNALKDSTE